MPKPHDNDLGTEPMGEEHDACSLLDRSTGYSESQMPHPDQEDRLLPFADIAFGKSTLHVTSGGYDLFDAPVYLFTADGAYLGQVQHTDSSGLASFMVPAGAYKFRVDYNGGQAWSPVINILAGEETATDLDLDALLSDLTLSPDPVRFDGTPPSYHPEKVLLASFGPLTGLLPASPDGQTTVDKLYYFIDDHLGTPQIVTDDAGAVVWKADYRPFGAADITVDKITNNLRFAGQYADAETGLHYNYHRYYDPSTGRYLTADPIGLAGGINLFAYTSNNPVNLIDPLGLAGLAIEAGGGAGSFLTGANNAGRRFSSLIAVLFFIQSSRIPFWVADGHKIKTPSPGGLMSPPFYSRTRTNLDSTMTGSLVINGRSRWRQSTGRAIRGYRRSRRLF
jgi:RHS repeat-associated protein